MIVERLYRKILKRNLLQVPRYKKGLTKLAGAKTLFVDSLSFLFMYREIFDNNVYQFVPSRLNPVIIDCGANIGLSLIYFKRIFPQAKIVAFEPDKDIFNVLQYNITESHQLSDIHLVNAALWVHENGINFKSEGADAGRIIENENNYIVPTCKLSNYLEEEVDFLKIDIEGAEYEVLKECGDKLRNVEQMFIEYHSFENKPQQLSQILDLLTRQNFRYYLTMPGLKSANPLIKLNKYAGMDMQVNIYAKRI
jgi:FkbM family methyltransferase